MKRMTPLYALLVFATLLAALLASAPAGTAETLSLSITDRVTVEAPMPENLPTSLPKLNVSAYALDEALLQAQFMPENQAREAVPSQNIVMLGDQNGDGDYMLLELTESRFYFSTPYSQTISDVRDFRDPMTDDSIHYPFEGDLAFMTRADAKAKALDLAKTLGIEVAEEVRIYALEAESFKTLQADLLESDFAAYVTDKLFETFTVEQEAYFIVLTPTLNGLPYDVYGEMNHFLLILTKDGYQFADTSFLRVLASKGAEETLLSVSEAAKSLAQVADKLGGDILQKDGEVKPVYPVIERVQLLYIPVQDAKGEMIPAYRFTYCNIFSGAEERETTQGAWRERTFDKPVFVKYVDVNAITGEVIKNMYSEY